MYFLLLPRALWIGYFTALILIFSLVAAIWAVEMLVKQVSSKNPRQMRIQRKDVLLPAAPPWPVGRGRHYKSTSETVKPLAAFSPSFLSHRRSTAVACQLC